MALSAPLVIIPSFMLGGAVAGGITAQLHLGSIILGGGLVTAAGVQDVTGTLSVGVAIAVWLACAALGSLISTTIICSYKIYTNRNDMTKAEWKDWGLNVASFGIRPTIHNYQALSPIEQKKLINNILTFGIINKVEKHKLNKANKVK